VRSKNCRRGEEILNTCNKTQGKKKFNDAHFKCGPEGWNGSSSLAELPF